MNEQTTISVNVDPLHEEVKRYTGPINPTGKPVRDGIRLRNMDKRAAITCELIKDIQYVANAEHGNDNAAHARDLLAEFRRLLDEGESDE